MIWPVRIALAVLLAASTVEAARAEYPEKPVRIVVGYPPGGPTDTVARLVAERLSQLNGRAFIVENKPGASSVIATGEVLRARPDGYTLLMAASNHASNPATLKSIPYDTARDLAGIMLVAEGPHVLVVHPGVPFKTVENVVEFARANPGKLTCSSSGSGGTVHFAGALFEEAAKVTLTHVPYRGAAPAIQDLVSGQVQLSFATLASVSSFLKAGRLRMLAVAAPQRLPQFPDVPTFAESGYPSVTLSAWAGLLAPAATPRPILEKLASQIRQIVDDAEVRQRLDTIGMVPVGTSLRDFDSQIEHEIELYGQVARARGIKSEE